MRAVYVCAPVQVVCALQTHQPAVAAGAGAVGTGTPAAEVPMLRFKVRDAGEAAVLSSVLSVAAAFAPDTARCNSYT